ncbi:pali-domain-containing protein [Xylariaceae sp. FL0016]|nr:pali-domain-containing protein [Xylariaceae sp. FL0016]
MLRPATPLAILLFAAFALLLLSVLSTPIIKAIPLGTFQGINFGVFGFCDGDDCSSIEIGYDTSDKFTDTESSTFDLPSSARTTLSAILIIHPVAALLTLIMFALAVIAHFHSPSHSSRYLCAVFIFGILTFIVCLLAFLIDVLLFVPHMAWGSYIVLAATILVFLSFIVSCAMRRTLVGRKARKKRIAENAEMSGENYYNRQATQDTVSPAAPTMQPTIPTISGANGPADKLPAFASYEKRDDRSDEHIPLTARTPSERSPNNAPMDSSPSDPMYDGRSQAGSQRSVRRDQYGNPMMNQPPDAYGMRRGPSMERMNGRGRGGPPGGYRGRGGNGRGGYGGGYGPPPNARGGYGPPGRGGYGPGPNGRGGYGPRGAYGGGMRGRGPPPGYPGAPVPYNGRTPPPPAAAYGTYGPGRQVSPGPLNAAYGANPSMPSISTGTTGTGSYEVYNPGRGSDLPRAESPPPLPGMESSGSGPVGQAVEMDAITGSPAHPPAGFGQFNNQLRDSDADVAGMLALQQARTSNAQRHDTYMSEGSKYSQDDSYVPPRQAWNQGPGRNSPGIAHPSQVPSPLNVGPRAQAMDSGTPPPMPPAANGGDYYEDVDPRFAQAAPRQQPYVEGAVAYDDPHTGAGSRSPAVSERSAFTSISQRGVNPQWHQPGPGYGQIPPRRPVNRDDVNILNSNPDFQLPGSRGGNSPPRGGAGAGGGMIPGSAYPGL